MQKKYKILYIDTPLDPPGGGQFSLLLLLRYLNKEKFEPLVFIPEEKKFAEILKQNNIKYKVVKNFGLFFEIKKYRPSIVHCNAPVRKYTFISATMAKIFEIPFIWHNRVVDFAGWREKLIFDFSDRVIVTSEAVKKKFLGFKNQNKIVKIYNGVDTERFKPGINTEKIKKEFNISDEGNIFGCIARFDKWKGLEYFVDMAKIIVEKIPESKFFLVGDGVERENLELKIKKLDLEDRFFLTGFRENIEEFISVFDVLVIPTSEEEPFGRTAIEAMACEKPVVATKSGGLVEIIDNGITGFLVEPKSGQALADACLWLAQNKEKAIEMGKRARETVEKIFSAEQYAKNIEKIYEKFISRM